MNDASLRILSMLDRPVPPLVWTDAKPVMPGWYWYRIRDSFPSRIVELRNLKHGGNFKIYVIGHGLLDSHEGQFAGPIPQPEESQ